MLRRQPPPWPAPLRTSGAWFRDHIRFINETLRHFALNAFTTLFVISLMSFAIALPAGLWIVSSYFEKGSWVWSNQGGFNVYFTDAANSNTIENFRIVLEEKPSIESTTLITKEAALTEYLTAAELTSVISDIQENPLPDTLSVRVIPAVQSTEIEQIIREIKSESFVGSVSYDPDLVLRFSTLNALINQLFWILGSTFCVFAVFVSASAVRGSIHSRLHEIRIGYLIGAPRRLLRGSFLWIGVAYGVLGGYFASVLLSLLILGIADLLEVLAVSYGLPREPYSLEWEFTMVLILVGFVLGLLGAYYSIWRHIQLAWNNWID